MIDCSKIIFDSLLRIAFGSGWTVVVVKLFGLDGLLEDLAFPLLLDWKVLSEGDFIVVFFALMITIASVALWLIISFHHHLKNFWSFWFKVVSTTSHWSLTSKCGFQVFRKAALEGIRCLNWRWQLRVYFNVIHAFIPIWLQFWACTLTGFLLFRVDFVGSFLLFLFHLFPIETSFPTFSFWFSAVWIFEQRISILRWRAWGLKWVLRKEVWIWLSKGKRRLFHLICNIILNFNFGI